MPNAIAIGVTSTTAHLRSRASSIGDPPGQVCDLTHSVVQAIPACSHQRRLYRRKSTHTPTTRHRASTAEGFGSIRLCESGFAPMP
jgi:hypothetical protein